MPNNDLISDLLKLDKQQEAYALTKVFKAQIKENPNFANSDLYIKIGDCYIKSLMFEHALKYYNEARYLELNNPEKQTLILEKIQELRVIYHSSFDNNKPEVEKCAINFNNKLKLASNVFAEKYNSFKESKKLLSQNSPFPDYLKAAECSLELRYYEQAIKYYGYARSAINDNEHTRSIIIEIQTKLALTQKEYMIKYHQKQTDVAKHLYEESDLKDVTLAGHEYNSDENIV